MTGDSAKGVNERAQRLLKALVEEYIRGGQPVGSKTLAHASQLQVSPATIRNIMADLEKLGLVESPHTSAGRVPTVQGYRFFVDSLLSAQPVEAGQSDVVEQFKQQMRSGQDRQSLVASASQFISGVTKMAGIVSLPRKQHMQLRQLEFISLSEKRALAILITEDGEVQNRILQLHREFSNTELQRIANYLNRHFVGRDIRAMQAALVRDMARHRADMDEQLRNAVEVAQQLVGQSEPEDDYVLAGEINLMNFEELCNINKLKELFEAFNQKQEIIHLLDQCIQSEGVQIFIGEESGYKALDECSVVTAPYVVNGRVLGVLGVIGPTRMPYDQVIPIVDVTAKVLGAALNFRS